jgi:membrane peptidoglycan carboxypeptidase
MKKVKKIILIFFIILMIIAASFLKSGYEYYESALQKTSMDEMINSIHSQENFTKFEDLPEDYINAVIAVEDRRFYIHPGIDPISIARAIGKDIISFKLVEGGSTITQQLAKNTYFTQSKNLTRKCAEIFMALKYEHTCTKEEIFELYVNTSYFGDGYYCVKDAANGYFDKDPIDMDLYECTLLAGIPNAPSVYAPTKNPELAMQRQAQVLKKMVKYKYLSQDRANEILNIRYDEYNEY